MNRSSANILLPHGFADCLQATSAHIAFVETRLMDIFIQHGFDRIDPPLFEYESSLLSENGLGENADIAKQTFRLMDPITQMMLAIRTDMTGQLGRIADSRLGDSVRPLRLSYSGKVLRVRGNSLQPLRQLTQIGCELFGCDNEIADGEMISLALKGLYEIKLPKAAVDLTLPSFVPTLLKGLSLGEEIKQDIRHALAQKDGSAVKSLLKGQDMTLVQTLVEILKVNGPAEEGFQRLEKMKMGDDLKRLLQPLQKIYKSAQKIMGEEDLSKTIFTLDLTDHSGFNYHHGVAFQIFANGLQNELGRGGRYRTLRKGETATGFSLYLEELIRIIDAPMVKPRLLIPHDYNFDRLRGMEQDFQMIRDLENREIDAKIAKDLGCAFYLDRNSQTHKI